MQDVIFSFSFLEVASIFVHRDIFGVEMSHYHMGQQASPNPSVPCNMLNSQNFMHNVALMCMIA
jgi:hypothetical protein